MNLKEQVRISKLNAMNNNSWDDFEEESIKIAEDYVDYKIGQFEHHIVPTVEDLEKLKAVLIKIGLSSPESIEELGARFLEYHRKVIRMLLFAVTTK